MLHSMGSQRVRHDLATEQQGVVVLILHVFTLNVWLLRFRHLRKKRCFKLLVPSFTINFILPKRNRSVWHITGTRNVWVLSCVWLHVTPWTIVHQIPLSMDFPSKNSGVGSHSLLQGIFLTQELNLLSLASSTLVGRFFTILYHCATWEVLMWHISDQNIPPGNFFYVSSQIPWRRAWQPTPVFVPGESPWTEEPGGLWSILSHSQTRLSN